MSSPQPENVPGLDSLCRLLESGLDGFDPDSLVYLDTDGEWHPDPRSMWQRASNEVWYRLWEARGGPAFGARCHNLFTPLISDAGAWKSTLGIFRAAPGGGAADASPLTAVTCALSSLVELAACDLNAAAHVPDWNRGGRIIREGFRRRLGVLRGVVGSGREEGEPHDLDRILVDLGFKRDSLFAYISKVAAREEWFREILATLVEDVRRQGSESASSDLIREHINPAAAFRSRLPEAFVRPCIDLVSDGSIDLSSGVQYEAVSLIGKVRDRRATAALTSALARTPLENALLRANLVFALGRMGHPAALRPMKQVLRGPRVPGGGQAGRASGFIQSPDVEKREAVWALGRMPEHARGLVGDLVRLGQTRDKRGLSYLAFALGAVGAMQRERGEEVDAPVVRTLSDLLKSKHLEVFEDAAAALTRMGFRGALDTVYSRNFRTAPALALKPSSTGLYELSETLLHLVSLKQPVVMAVTGDSGTGKTYFCQAISAGFPGMKAHEILYLMRDRRGDHTFDRMLGLEWLVAHVDPEFYETYEKAETGDDPAAFFQDFMARHARKKLIILDGWRDRAYFDKVIKIFYENGCLDVIVRFKTTFSTRRANLEAREGTLEGVDAHLPLREEPEIEDTGFYREGSVLVYNLDNSIASRLNAAETLEIFSRKKVPGWTDQIRLGRFEAAAGPVAVTRRAFNALEVAHASRREPLSPPATAGIETATKGLERTLNADLGRSPCLLEEARPAGMDVAGIDFYTHGQVAFWSTAGDVGVMVGFDDRVYSARAHESRPLGVAVVGKDLVSYDDAGTLAITRLEEGRAALLGGEQPVTAIAACGSQGMVTGHADGSLKFWDRASRELRTARIHRDRVLAIRRDRRGRIVSAGADGLVCVTDPEGRRGLVLEGYGGAPSCLDWYPDGRIVLAVSAGSSQEESGAAHLNIGLVDPERGESEWFDLGAAGRPLCLQAYFDGRIIVGAGGPVEGTPGTLLIVDPVGEHPSYLVLPGHGLETSSCLTMGPRLLTCGMDDDARRSVRIWGTEPYVRAEHARLSLLAGARTKPPYYRSLF
jgi:hypothetical protein